MLLEPNQKIVFIGDSITDAGRRDIAAPYGNGYVSMVRNMLIARYPHLNLTFVNRGVSGNTVREIAARYERDVVSERPHWLSLMVGINDVYRQFHGDPATAVFPVEYQATLRLLVHRVQDAFGTKVILLSPYMIEPDREQPMRRQMEVYAALMAQVAAEFKTLYVDLQEAFAQVLRVSVPQLWSDDKFHPFGVGHALIAREWLRAVQFTL
jgi:lysophospholipase L1-like esterase